MPSVLAPYRVLDLTTSEGWLCGGLLADLGADVVKVEPPGGDPGRRRGTFAGDRLEDPESGLEWWFACRGKRSLILDPRAGEDIALLNRLMDGADVILESPGAAGAHGRRVDAGEILRRNPRAVVTSISGFGLDGPYAGFRGPDLVVSALSGLLWLTGDEDRPPVRVSVPQAYALASVEAVVHTLVALWHASRTGEGQHVDVAAVPVMVRTLMNATDFQSLQGVPITRKGDRVSYASNRPRFIYPCIDGHVVFMSAFGTLGGPGLELLLEWAKADGVEVPAILAEADVYDPATARVVDEAGRTAEMTAAIETTASLVFETRTKADLYASAVERRMLLAPASTVADLHGSPQLAARDFWKKVEAPDGTVVTFPGPWARLSATPLVEGARAPRIGEHGTPDWVQPRLLPAATEASGPDPFAGLKVWDMSWVGVGPLTARYLADYGATVVRLDNPSRPDVLRLNPPFAGGLPGINRSLFYADYNTSKLGIGLDLSHPGGRELARRLAAWADVVIESFTPGTLQGFGLDYEALAVVNPSLVMLSTCMQGQTGPCSDYRGFGQMLTGLSGFYEVTGWPDRGPGMVWGAYTDFVSQRFCAAALIAAVDHRRRTGEGQHIDVSQLEASLHLLGPSLLDFAVNGRVARRAGNRDPHAAPHGVYPCRPAGAGPEGERWIAIVCEDDGQWAALVEVMGRPGWATDPALETLAGRQARHDDLDRRLAEWTAEFEVYELFGHLQPRVAAAPVLWPEALHDDPQLRHLGYFVPLDHPVIGTARYNGMQARLSRTPGRLRKSAPCVGEDSMRILTELLGCSEDEAVGFMVEGAVEIDCG